MMKHRHLKSIGIALVLCLSLLSGCAKPVQMADKDENVILCTTFAAYDWVREILGDTDTFTCRMLVDNGVDLHSYQPSAQDIMKIANCRMICGVSDFSSSSSVAAPQSSTKTFRASEYIAWVLAEYLRMSLM